MGGLVAKGPVRLLFAARCQLLFLWRHLSPEHLQIGGDARVLWVLMESASEPAIRSRQVPADAVASGVHGSEDGFSLGIAMRGNPKAETVLGTMYATGHCVGRDLPAAYRWFARALHQDPQNSRISADLQVLWRQMTPQEKQLATGSKQ